MNNSPPRIAEFLPAVCARSLFLADWSRATAPFGTGEWPGATVPLAGDGRCSSMDVKADLDVWLFPRARPSCPSRDYAIQTDLMLTNSRMPYSESSRP